MDRKKKEDIIGIVTGIIIGLVLVGLWTLYIFTLPDLSEQLKYSPFYVSGTWECDSEDFVITSSQDLEVSAVLVKDEKTYNFGIYFLSTRGFNHKYAATIQIETEDLGLVYSCYYEFKENEFILKDFYYCKGDEVFSGIDQLKFIKVA